MPRFDPSRGARVAREARGARGARGARWARGAAAAKKRRDGESRHGKRRVEEEEIFYARERDLPAARFHHVFPSRFRLINSSNRSSFASSSPTSSTKVESTGSPRPPSSAPSTSCASPLTNSSRV